MAEFKDDYTKDSGINDKMVSASSPMNDYHAEDNIEFEATQEIEGMPPQGGSFKTNTSDTRIEINQPDNSLYVYQDGIIVAYFTGQSLGFNTPAGVGSGAIYGLGTNAIVIDVGTGGSGYIFDDGALYPDPGSTLDLGRSSARWDTIYLVNAPNVSSDRRLKTDIKDLDYGLVEILKLKPSRFKMGGKEKIGLIAQDVYEVIPEVTEDVGKEDVMASIRYQDLIPVLIKAVHDQQDQINKLSERVESLEKLLVV